MRDNGSDYESQQDSKYSGSRKRITKQAPKPAVRNFYQVEMKNFNVWLHSIYNHGNPQIMTNVQHINQFLIECYPNTGEKVLAEFFRLQFTKLPKSWHQYKVALIGYLQQDDTINRKKFQPSVALTLTRQKFIDHIVNPTEWKTPKQGKGHASIQTLVEKINTLEEAIDDTPDKPSNAIQPSTTPAQVNSRSPSSKRSPSKNTQEPHEPHENSSHQSANKLSPPRNLNKRVIKDDSESNKNINTTQVNDQIPCPNPTIQQPLIQDEPEPINQVIDYPELKEDHNHQQKEDFPFEAEANQFIEESQQSHHEVLQNDQPQPCPLYPSLIHNDENPVKYQQPSPPPSLPPPPKQVFMHSPPHTPVLMTPQEVSHPQVISPMPQPMIGSSISPPVPPSIIPPQYLQALLQPQQQQLYQPIQMLQNLQQQQPPQQAMPPYPYFGVLQNSDPQNQQNMMFLQQVEMAQQRQFQLALNWLGYQNFLYTQYQVQLAREQQQQEQN